jgi:hypothetical protein
VLIVSLINIKTYHHLTHSYNLIYNRASSRLYSLVNSLYFHWLFTILLCADWLTVNQKKTIWAVRFTIQVTKYDFFYSLVLKAKLLLWLIFQVSKWIYIYSTCDSDIVEAKLKIWKKVTEVENTTRVKKQQDSKNTTKEKKTASSRMHSLPS